VAAGSIYLVPVPIGNLGDITLRALETLKSVSLITAEDTRKTRTLLSHYRIKAPKLLSLHKYNEKQRVSEILALLEEGNDLAVVSAAGTPGISDPATILIQSAIAANIRVVPLPGATALIPALTASGLDTRAFLFLGFLPLKQKDRRLQLDRIKDSPFTAVIYEAPHRLRKTLDDLHSHLGNRKVCLAREISKLYEEFIRGDLESIVADHDLTEKGEFVIVIGAQDSITELPEEQIVSYLNAQEGRKTSLRSLAHEVSARFGVSRNQAYKLVLAHRDKRK